MALVGAKKPKCETSNYLAISGGFLCFMIHSKQWDMHLQGLAIIIIISHYTLSLIPQC